MAWASFWLIGMLLAMRSGGYASVFLLIHSLFRNGIADSAGTYSGRYDCLQ